MIAQPTPLWTAELRKPTSGLDHLGLGSVSSGQILTRLAPGINVLTTHPRYHAFYAFVLDEFWERDDLARDRPTWRDFFRPKAFIFSVAANMCDHPDYQGTFGGIIGSVRTGSLARHPPDSGFVTDYDYIKEPLGGYGLYYRTVMAALGLIYPSPESGYPLDVPTDRGRDLAALFRDGISGTDYWNRFFDKTNVPAEAVAEYGNVACPCRLRSALNADRELMRNIMLYGGSETHASARRASLRMMSDIAHHVGGAISQDDFRQLAYFRNTIDGRSWSPSDLPTPDGQWTIRETSRRWRIYQAREFHAYAINRIWSWLIDWGVDRGGVGRPPKTSDAIDALVNKLSFERLAESLGFADPQITATTQVDAAERRLRVLAGELEILPAADAAWTDRPFDLERLNEWALYEAAASTDQDVQLTAAIALLLLTHSRFSGSGSTSRPEWTYAQLGGRSRLSMDQFQRDLARHRRQGSTLGDLAEWLLRTYVIGQHLRVAASKLPFNTYRFTREGDYLRFVDKPRPVAFNDSRFNAMAFTLVDLGLAGPLGLDEHPLDEAGTYLRETGDLEGNSP